MNEIVRQKRNELSSLIERYMAPNSEVQAVVGVGSVATGLARPDSDIDGVIFFDPFDPYIVPAEFKWDLKADTFHSIFEPGLTIEPGRIAQFEFKRERLPDWKSRFFRWPESSCALLSGGWIAYDRTGEVTELIRERTTYSDAIRLEKLDEAIMYIDQNLADEKAMKRWRSLDAAVAHNRLHAASDYLIQALFAYNRRWRPWRNREMGILLHLDWLPENFAARILDANHIRSIDEAGYLNRLNGLRRLFEEVQQRLISDGLYTDDILNEAFVRLNDEPGRAWNMDEWNETFKKRRMKSD